MKNNHQGPKRSLDCLKSHGYHGYFVTELVLRSEGLAQSLSAGMRSPCKFSPAEACVQLRPGENCSSHALRGASWGQQGFRAGLAATAPSPSPSLVLRLRAHPHSLVWVLLAYDYDAHLTETL